VTDRHDVEIEPVEGEFRQRERTLAGVPVAPVLPAEREPDASGPAVPLQEQSGVAREGFFGGEYAVLCGLAVAPPLLRVLQLLGGFLHGSIWLSWNVLEHCVCPVSPVDEESVQLERVDVGSGELPQCQGPFRVALGTSTPVLVCGSE